MPRRSLSTLVAASLLAGLLAGVGASAQARPPLREVEQIDNGLMVIAIADDIRKRCDDIDARMLSALSFLHSLKAEAGRLGYSRDEVSDYVNSGAEKRRMRDKATAYLAGQGVDATNKQQICDFGRTQMAQGGPIGRLLR